MVTFTAVTKILNKTLYIIFTFYSFLGAFIIYNLSDVTSLYNC